MKNYLLELKAKEIVYEITRYPYVIDERRVDYILKDLENKLLSNEYDKQSQKIFNYMINYININKNLFLKYEEACEKERNKK